MQIYFTDCRFESTDNIFSTPYLKINFFDIICNGYKDMGELKLQVNGFAISLNGFTFILIKALKKDEFAKL